MSETEYKVNYRGWVDPKGHNRLTIWVYYRDKLVGCFEFKNGLMDQVACAKK